jgi:hypothetical protein
LDISKLKPREIVSVTWSDSSYKKGWHYPPYEFGDPITHVKTIGFVVQADAKMLVVAAAIESGGGVLCPLFIPAHAVEKLEVL